MKRLQQKLTLFCYCSDDLDDHGRLADKKGKHVHRLRLFSIFDHENWLTRDVTKDITLSTCLSPGHV